MGLEYELQSFQGSILDESTCRLTEVPWGGGQVFPLKLNYLLCGSQNRAVYSWKESSLHTEAKVSVTFLKWYYDLERREASEGPHQAKQFHVRFIERRRRARWQREEKERERDQRGLRFIYG